MTKQLDDRRLAGTCRLWRFGAGLLVLEQPLGGEVAVPFEHGAIGEPSPQSSRIPVLARGATCVSGADGPQGSIAVNSSVATQSRVGANVGAQSDVTAKNQIITTQ
jgi:hypothetical protein